MAFEALRKLFVGDKSVTDAAGNSARAARIINTVTGMGTSNDRSLATMFQPVRIERSQAEAIYQMSWAAAKMIDIPVDDMFVRGRRWTDDNEKDQERINEAETELNAMANLANAIKAARIFGSSLVIICTDNEADFETELDVEKIEEGSITNLWVVDRWSTWVKSWQTDPTKKKYGMPHEYYVHSRTRGLAEGESLDMRTEVDRPSVNTYTVHESRVIRFDGNTSPLTEGWIHGPFEREWGVSLLTRVIDDITRDVSMATGVGHLMEECSVWVNKIQGYKESLMGRVEKGDPSPEEIAQTSSLLRSIWRTQFIDSEDEADRVAVTFAGVAEVMNQQARRIAAQADIPFTRFMSESPAGLNATGESDANNYAIMVQANQKRVLEPALHKLDPVIAKHAGLKEPLEYEWLTLFDMSDSDKSESSRMRTESISMAFKDRAIDETEYRELLSKDDYAFMPLSEDFEPAEDPVLEATRMKLEATAAQPAPGKKPMPGKKPAPARKM